MPGAALLCFLLLSQSAFERGAAHYRERNYTAAIEALEQALKLEAPDSPNRTEAVLLLGQSYYSSNRFADAIPLLEKSRGRSEVQYMLGTAYAHTRQFAKARQAFAELYGLPPDSAGARLINAQMLVRNGFEEEAAAEIDPALEKGTLPGLHLLAGELAVHRGDHEAAVKHLKEELRVNPASSTAHYKLGDAFTRRETWPEAIAHLQKSIWLNPYYSGPYILLGKVYLRTESLGNAEGMLRRAIQLDPGNSMAHFLLGQTLIRSGRRDEGKAMLQRSQDLPRAR